ncbi:MAG: phosphate/phosphite/phosphonate ABC transporter substrate-binding protein [Lactococcus lactis]
MKKTSKKVIGLTASALIAVSLLAACGNSSSASKSDSKTISNLKISFIPSKNPDDITTATKPIANILKSELKKQGYTVKNIDTSVGTNYQAVGEGLDAGSVDVGYGMSATTYAMYQDGSTPLLMATRKGLSNDGSDSAKYWNEHKPTTKTDKEVTSYSSLIIAGNSPMGKKLAKEANDGTLTWKDLNDAKWGLESTSSAAGYMYPSQWLTENFKHSIRDLKNTVTMDSYDSAMAQLASGQIDVMPEYADARMDDAAKWTTTFGAKESIWDDTNVIGVTPAIANDGIMVSEKSKIMTADFKKALSAAIKDVAKTDEGKKVIAIYSHDGYVDSTKADYKTAIKVANSMSKAN